MSFLSELALAHQRHEGYYPGSRSWRNNNPGNLRAGPPSDSGGFTIFKNYNTGFQALINDVKAKITGKSKHIDYSRNPTFLTYIKVYAPADDGNSPTGYCQALCKELAHYGVQPDTPLTELARLVRGEIASIGSPGWNSAMVSPEARIKGLLRRLKNTTDETLIGSINRLLDRLYKRIGRT